MPTNLKSFRRRLCPTRRSVVIALGGLGIGAVAGPALAQFGLNLGGNKDGSSGFSLNLDKLFSSVQNLFEGLDLGEDDEIRIGEQLYPKMVDRSGGAYANRRVQAAMDRFAEPLIKTSERARFDWEITVINDNKVNAWALPGGKLGVNKGVLRYVDDESELAAVIAHEIGHAELSHGLKQLKSKKFTEGLSDAAQAAISTQVQTDQLLTDKVIEQLEEPIHQMVTGGYSRDLERASDQHILELFAKTGHDPSKAANFFKLLLELVPKDNTDATSLFATHPETRKRIAAIEKQARRMSRSSVPPPAEGFAAIKRTFPTRKIFRRRA